MSSLSTHVLDAATGTPAVGMSVVVTDADGAELGAARTDSDGRIGSLATDLDAATYRIRFDTGAWFAASGTDGFYPEIVICFEITDRSAHHHVPVLLSPFAYSTYRGS
ncbi:hydroxyisourate hydrolase [Williamsia sp. CHRR-6]|uniref:hydroxyisourate hydrolase n=1 Tax=Williamsia sp. CHRR-6 TaxID=2835871 RepID=UPI001BD9E7CD|nr:hydroxyisourate hydrolase [Williamsia sp. CHRR-6]MBT0567425.1 hydroxyisourate hydrolase [Williamsia sp. CHRR-6]